MENKKRIYLSGAISGYDLVERKATFLKKKQLLEANGYDVVSPLENGVPHDAPTSVHMKRDFELLLTCDAIYMMSGWLRSAGCKVEFDVATASGLEVFFEVFDGLEGFNIVKL